MANPWFRLYAEFATDPKVQMMSEADQRRYIMLLCNRCSNGDVTLHETEVAFQLRISDEEWAKTKAVFVSKNLITNDNKLTNWDKRQFLSDSSTARVKKHRAKNETLQKRPSNGVVTPPDTDTDTEKEDKNPLFADANESKKSTPKQPGEFSYSEPFERFWSAFPTRRRTAKPKCFEVWKRQKLDQVIDVVLADLAKKKQSEDWTKQGGEFVPGPLPYLNQGRWTDALADDSPKAQAAAASDDPYVVVGDEWVWTLRSRMGGRLFANTPKERELVEIEAKARGWTPKPGM